MKIFSNGNNVLVDSRRGATFSLDNGQEGQSIVHNFINNACPPNFIVCSNLAPPLLDSLCGWSHNIKMEWMGLGIGIISEQWHQNDQAGLLIATLTWQPWWLGTPPGVCWQWVVLAAQIAGWLPVWTQGHQPQLTHWYHSGTPSTGRKLLWF